MKFFMIILLVIGFDGIIVNVSSVDDFLIDKWVQTGKKLAAKRIRENDPFRIFKYGCYFDDQYDAQRKTNSEVPIVGSRRPKVVYFKDEVSLNKWIDGVSVEYAKFLNTEVYNSVDILLDFFKTCQRQRYNLRACFKYFFRPHFSLVHDSSGLAVKWLEQLKQSEYTVGEAAYLSYAKLKPFKGTCESSPGICDPRSVATFIQLVIEAKRPVFGYVLFDPGFAQDKPVIVFEEEYEKIQISKRDTARTTAWKDAGQEFEYRFDNNTIYGYSNIQRPDTNRILYDVEYPYCSFLNHSVKPSVLSPKPMIVRRNSKGQVLAALSTVLYPRKSTPAIYLDYQEDKLDGDIYSLEIPVKDVESVLRKSENQWTFKLTSEALGMTEKDLKIKIRRLAEIFDNEGSFITKMETLARAYGVDYPDRGYFWDSKPIYVQSKSQSKCALMRLLWPSPSKKDTSIP